MQNNLLKDYWKAWGFVNSYKTLDQDWQTKLALYREAMTTAASLKPFNQRTSVIDLGGGLGTLSTIAANDFGDSLFALWTVCDSSFEMMIKGLVFQLQDKVQDEKSICFVQADIQNHLPFASNSFDIVFCINFLYLFDDHFHTTIIAPEITRILRDKGLLVAITPKPKAINGKVILDEVFLRSKNNRFSIFSVLKDIVINLHFLSAQSKIIKQANKKFPAAWAQLYSAATHKKLQPCLYKLTKSYGGQAGLWVLQKHDS